MYPVSNVYVHGGQGHVGDFCEVMSHVEGSDGFMGETEDVDGLRMIHVGIIRQCMELQGCYKDAKSDSWRKRREE